MGVEKYVEFLYSLMPRGLAFSRDPNSFTFKMIEGIAEELYRIEIRGNNILDEADPRTTNELLPDWERALGLPDDCTGEGPTLQARRNEVLAKLTGIGGINKQFYIDLAASLGFPITIREYRPFYVGRASVGDPLSNGPWRYTWQVNAPAATYLRFSVGQSAVGEPLVYAANDTLQCAIDKRKPAETIVLFAFNT